jgi:hypothetical protein
MNDRPANARIFIGGQTHAVDCQPAPALRFGNANARMLSKDGTSK